MEKYVKNFILCGDIDHYCLLCQELFKNIPDVEKHIRWEKHRKSIKNQALFPRFKKDLIYKVANKYYCEICNLVVFDIAAVTEHINNDAHKVMKNNPKKETKNFIGQYDSGFIIINKVILNMAQWNSVVNKNCFLCNMKVQNIDEHIALEEHIINLIQSETKCGNEPFYRKINEDRYHCFTCKKVFTALNFSYHLLRCENIDEIEIKNLKEVGSSKNIRSTPEDKAKMEELQKRLISPMQEFYLIDEKNNSATCKYCKSVVAINFKFMLEHMKIHHENQVTEENPKTTAGLSRSAEYYFNSESSSTSDSREDLSESSTEEEVTTTSLYQRMKITDFGQLRSELSKYGKQNSIKLNFNSRKGWCLLCDRYLEANKTVFKEHIRGALHRGHLELQGLKGPKNHGPRNFKTKSILRCNLKYSTKDKVFYVNQFLSIEVYSFFLLLKIEKDPHFKKTKCYACNELFPQGLERQHCETPNHKKNFLAAKFIKSWGPEEFFREIRPNLFHCGFCNKTLPFLELADKHSDSSIHDMLKEDPYYNSGDIDINTKSEDAYLKLLQYGFGDIQCI